MTERQAPEGGAGFEAAVVPHLDAAYNLARWLMRNAADADDVVQEAVLRAATYFASFRGTNARAWLLRIVRNTAYAAKRPMGGAVHVALPEDGVVPTASGLVDSGDDPETALLRRERDLSLAHELASLPSDLREVVVLRELEELSYKEIAQVVGVPIGTVMSRLWRGRQLLAAALKAAEGSGNGGM